MTILREPVTRFLSHFYFAKYTARHHLHDSISTGKLTLPEAAQKLGNIVTRYLAGDAAPNPAGAVDEAMFEVAKRNLEERFAFVGMVERFEENLVFFQRQLGWKVGPYANSNVNRARGEGDCPSAEELELIRASNRFDLALYAWAGARFEARVAAAGESFRRELAQMRRANRLRGWVHALKGFLPPRRAPSLQVS